MASKFTSKIFGIGLSRTGTTKLASILKELGFNTLDFAGPLLGYDSKGNPINRDWSVLNQYDAITDSPMPLLYRQLDKMYPGSRFILTTRDIDSWLASMHWMLTEGKVKWNYGPRINAYHSDVYGTSTFKSKVLRASWIAYHEEVYQFFAERTDLLIIDITSGFDVVSICKFLDTDYLDINFDSVVNGRVELPIRKHAKYWIRSLLHKMPF